MADDTENLRIYSVFASNLHRMYFLSNRCQSTYSWLESIIFAVSEIWLDTNAATAILFYSTRV